MEESISTLCKTLATFCNHLESSSHALKQSVERRPIPLDSASSTFVQCLNRKVSSASSDLNLLETMSFGTVSFEELLGHCNEVYKKNESHLFELQDRLSSLGYVPEIDADDEKDEVSGLSMPFGLDSKVPNPNDGLDLPSSVVERLEEDSLFDDSLSLQNLGLSDVCLATLASEANGKDNKPEISLREPVKNYKNEQDEIMTPYQLSTESLATTEGDDLMLVGASKSLMKVSKDDYESLPSYIKSLASWEDLLAAVEKMNSSLSKKENKNGGNFFYQDELDSLQLGPKARSYLLLLLRMNQLVVETIDGLISYRVL